VFGFWNVAFTIRIIAIPSQPGISAFFRVDATPDLP